MGGAQVGAGARVKAREVKRRSCLIFILFSSIDRDRDCFTIFFKKMPERKFFKIIPLSFSAFIFEKLI